MTTYREKTPWLSPPRFANDEQNRIAHALHTVILVLFAGTVFGSFAIISQAAPIRIAALASLAVIEIISYFLLRSGRLQASALFLCSASWAILVIALIFTGGVDGSSNPVLSLIVISAGLLLGGMAGLIFAILNTLAGLVMTIAELNGILPPSLVEITPFTYWLFSSLTFLSAAGLISITTRSLREAVNRAERNEKAQIETNRQLEEARANLENQVHERTASLEQRSRYLQATIEVTRAAASILDTGQLLQQAVELIGEQFSLYYVGLFLLDPDGEWAVLQAGTGTAGRRMMDKGHRLRIGTGMVGWSIANAQPRIALHSEEDAMRFANPELPETRSEAAIPLRSRGKILGAISVQSKYANAFGDIEITAFQAMADQVALAIDNARLYQDSQQAIQEVQRAYGISSRMAWREMLESGRNISQLSHQYDIGKSGARIIELSGSQLSATNDKQSGTKNWNSAMRQAAHTRQPIMEKDEASGQAFLYVPIAVREQVVGVLTLNRPAEAPPWSEEETTILRALSEQLGIALESARLYQDSQRLAMREQLTSEVTGRIRETLDVEMVLKTAVQEIQRSLATPGAEGAGTRDAGRSSPEVIISLRKPETL